MALPPEQFPQYNSSPKSRLSSAPSGLQAHGSSGREPLLVLSPESARLFEGTQKIAILYDASQAALSGASLDQVLNQILTILRDHFPIHSATVFLLDQNKEEMYARAHLGPKKRKADERIAVDFGLAGAAVRVKRPMTADVGDEAGKPGGSKKGSD